MDFNEAPGHISKYEELGMMVALALQSGLHRNWLLSDIERYLEPALHSRQCRLFFRNNGPVAFATWAFVDDAIHAQFLANDVPLPPQKWTSGANTWLIDVVAPFGDATGLVRHLQKNELATVARAYSVKRNLDGSRNRVKIWRNESRAKIAEGSTRHSATHEEDWKLSQALCHLLVSGLLAVEKPPVTIPAVSHNQGGQYGKWQQFRKRRQQCR